MEVLQPPRVGTIYVPWASVAYLQIGENVLIQRPAFISSYLEADFNTSTWPDTVNDTLTMLNQARKLNTSDVISILEGFPTFSDYTTSFKIGMYLSSVSLTFSALLALVITFPCWKGKLREYAAARSESDLEDDPSPNPEIMIVT